MTATKTTTGTAKAEKKVKQLAPEKAIKNLAKSLSSLDATILVERIQESVKPLKEAIKTEKNPMLQKMYGSVIAKVEEHLSNVKQ